MDVLRLRLLVARPGVIGATAVAWSGAAPVRCGRGGRGGSPRGGAMRRVYERCDLQPTDVGQRTAGYAIGT